MIQPGNCQHGHASNCPLCITADQRLDRAVEILIELGTEHYKLAKEKEGMGSLMHSSVSVTFLEVAKALRGEE